MSGSGVAAVATDRLDRTAFHGFFAESALFSGLGLLVDVRIAAVLVAGEIGGGRLAAKVAVDALVIDVKFAGNVVCVAVFEVSHRMVFVRVTARPGP